MSDDWDEAYAESEKVEAVYREEAARVEALAAAYREKWPARCPRCLGWGGSVFYQGHPYGSTTAYETLFDVCGECVESGRCPRCGTPSWPEGQGVEEPCPSCSWTYSEQGEPTY
jgi:hypothetical protein